MYNNLIIYRYIHSLHSEARILTESPEQFGSSHNAPLAPQLSAGSPTILKFPMKHNITAPHIVHQYSTYVQIKGISIDCKKRFLYCWLGLLIRRLYLSQHTFSAVECGHEPCAHVLSVRNEYGNRPLASHHAQSQFQTHINSTPKYNQIKQLKTELPHEGLVPLLPWSRHLFRTNSYSIERFL
jgi:hypothetical protein